MNAVVGILGIVLLIAGMVCFGYSFVVQDFMIPLFALGLVLASSSFGLPVLILDRLDRSGR